ncbi:MAG: InlB B-repeat-containing protein [Clostridia bacterium]|nr:InlB B-repeat-containing protein [Clostridia bacterium]
MKERKNAHRAKIGQGLFRLLLVGLCVLLALPSGSFRIHAAAPEPVLTLPKAERKPSSALTALDYSAVGQSDPVQWKPSELISALIGKAPSALEAAWIDAKLPVAFSYHDAIPSQSLTTEFRDSTLYVRAKMYEYQTADGVSMQWIPQYAAILGRKVPLEKSDEDGDVYIGSVLGLAEGDFSGESPTVELGYSCRVALPVAETEIYLNYVYRQGEVLCRTKAEYEEALAKYTAYRDYLSAMETYENDLIRWNLYQTEKAKYDRKYAEYTEYLAAYAQYQERKAAREAYEAALAAYDSNLAAYKRYLTENAQYEKDYQAYEAYLIRLNAVTKKLAVMESLFVKGKNEHIMYATLNGDTVKTVVERKSELVTVGKCDERDINHAAESTEMLKKLLSEYKNQGSNARKLEYYKAHYEEIRDNFILLYSSLHSLYQNPAVVGTLSNYGKLDRFMEFLAHLYVISTALDDEQNRYEGWKIRGLYDMEKKEYLYYSYTDLLDEVQLIHDTGDADPRESGAWPDEVPQPIKPIKVEPPVMPTYVPEPVEPKEVSEPPKPQPVAEPQKPTVVEDPGYGEPDPVSFTPEELALIEAISENRLAEREVPDGAMITLHTAVTRKVPLLNRHVVTFLDSDRKTVLLEYEVEGRGHRVTFPEKTPEKTPSAQYSYRFSGWVDESGTPATATEITEPNTIYYASYETTVNRYTVTWHVGDQSVTEAYDYGQTPRYKGSLVIEPSKDTSYVFLGWSANIVPVTGDAEYTALYKEKAREYTVTWHYRDRVYKENYAYGATPSFRYSTEPVSDSLWIYTFSGWNQEPAPVTADVSYEAKFSVSPFAVDEKGEAVCVSEQESAYEIFAPGNTLKVGNAVPMAVTRGKQLVLVYNTTRIILNDTALEQALEAGLCEITVQNPPATEGAWHACMVEFLDCEGKKVTLPYGAILQWDAQDADRESLHTYLSEDSEKPNREESAFEIRQGWITVRLSHSSAVWLYREYSVQAEPCENALLQPSVRQAYADQNVHIEVLCGEEYEVSAYYVKGMVSGKMFPVSPDGWFVMPDEPVSVSSVVSFRRFTVSFKVGDTVIASAVYNYGDTVKVPADPIRKGSDTIVYNFVGWSPEITVVRADVVYEAQFKEAKAGEAGLYPSYSRNRFYLLIVECLLLLGALIATPIVLVHFRKKKKSQEATKENEKGDKEPKTASEGSDDAAKSTSEDRSPEP